jgi:hypothetical protein
MNRLTNTALKTVRKYKVRQHFERVRNDKPTDTCYSYLRIKAKVVPVP